MLEMPIKDKSLLKPINYEHIVPEKLYSKLRPASSVDKLYMPLLNSKKNLNLSPILTDRSIDTKIKHNITNEKI